MLAQSLTESEIAQELGVDQSTISRDVKTLKELSQQFVYDLAKELLAFKKIELPVYDDTHIV